MADELKDQRIPIMMSPSEVKAIDDWMFENRMKSRSAAIRKLSRLGILFEPTYDLARKSIDLLKTDVHEDLSHTELLEKYTALLHDHANILRAMADIGFEEMTQAVLAGQIDLEAVRKMGPDILEGVIKKLQHIAGIEEK